jgi:hypothetical protein
MGRADILGEEMTLKEHTDGRLLTGLWKGVAGPAQGRRTVETGLQRCVGDRHRFMYIENRPTGNSKT